MKLRGSYGASAGLKSTYEALMANFTFYSPLWKDSNIPQCSADNPLSVDTCYSSMVVYTTQSVAAKVSISENVFQPPRFADMQRRTIIRSCLCLQVHGYTSHLTKNQIDLMSYNTKVPIHSTLQLFEQLRFFSPFRILPSEVRNK